MKEKNYISKKLFKSISGLMKKGKNLKDLDKLSIIQFLISMILVKV